MDAVGRFVYSMCALLLLLGITISVIAHRAIPKTPPSYPLALCIDPFTSADLGQTTWTWCKLVPMWSMKV